MQILKSSVNTFKGDNEERPNRRSGPDFVKDIEFQIKHDIRFSLMELNHFLDRAAK